MERGYSLAVVNRFYELLYAMRFAFGPCLGTVSPGAEPWF